jgi:hypothetical protein
MPATARHPMYTRAKLFPTPRQRNPQRRIAIQGCTGSDNWREGDRITLERAPDGYPLVNKTPVLAVPYRRAGIVALRFLSIVWTVKLSDYAVLFPEVERQEGAQSA